VPPFARITTQIPIKTVTLHVNGQPRTAEVTDDTPLLWVLRDHLDLVGTKFGCGMGLCGACTVHVDGKAVRSCSLPVSAVGEQKVTTIEGLATEGKLTTVQQAWCDLDVAQCGYCQAGQIMCATALLAEKSKPTDDDIDAAMSGNLCRCATYKRIRQAIHTAAVQ
jgi:isoquinoline 1-oxidoreductase alpha subunit